MSISTKINHFYYILLVLTAIIFPLTYYPQIYGVDAFQLVWMAEALREGALFSNNTWLIHPTSYFGYYPFSHRAIGVPMVLAFLINLLELISFGVFGLAESILVFDIILIIIIYKNAKKLGNTLFEEEWTRFIFIAIILFTPNIIREITMTVSSRVIITITMIILINLSIKILNKSIKKFKGIMNMFLFLFIGALAHRLWMMQIITIIFILFIVFIIKYQMFQKPTFFIILPITIILFFIGLEILSFRWLIRRESLLPSFLNLNSILGTSSLLILFYLSEIGLILIFFPIGVIGTLSKLISKKNEQSNDKENLQFFNINCYLLLFLIPFFFMSIYITYSIILFLPILIIFSVKGLIYFRNYISTYFKNPDLILPITFLILFFGYIILNVNYLVKIDLWDLFSIFFISSIALIFFFILRHFKTVRSVIKLSYWSIKKRRIFKNRQSRQLFFLRYKLKRKISLILLLFPIFLFLTISMQITIYNRTSSSYPWENIYLTNEEIEVINYFHDKDIDGLIFCVDGSISNKVAGAGFLPVFSSRNPTGMTLYYGFINPNEVHKNTIFSLTELVTFDLFYSKYMRLKFDPIRQIKSAIIILNMTYTEDCIILRYEYGVQYIISINNNYSHESNEWTLIKSLQQSEITPVFSTLHLLIWKI